MSSLPKQLLAAALLLGLAAGAGAWQGPTQAPPGGNAAAPVNVGAAAQSKQGTLGVGGLGVFGRGFITSAAGYSLPANLNFGVNGSVGAAQYCDQNGQNCRTPGGGVTPTLNIGEEGCRIAVSQNYYEWGEVTCADDEAMTGGGCRSHGGAYSYYDYPFMKDGKMYWGCSSGSTGTYAEAFAICCAIDNDRPNETSRMSNEQLANCIDPATWTWTCGPVR